MLIGAGHMQPEKIVEQLREIIKVLGDKEAIIEAIYLIERTMEKEKINQPRGPKFKVQEQADYTCPNCERFVHHFAPYCHACLQRLDWKAREGGDFHKIVKGEHIVERVIAE